MIVALETIDKGQYEFDEEEAKVNLEGELIRALA